MSDMVLALTDDAAWVWPLAQQPAQPQRFAADAEGHAGLLRCLGALPGEVRCHVLLDLAAETLHETRAPALAWRDRRALARLRRQEWYPADSVARLRWLAQKRGQARLQACGLASAEPWLTWLHLIASSPASVIALHSATLLGAELASAQAGHCLLAQPSFAGLRLSWLCDGVPRHTRRLCAEPGAQAATLSSVLHFFASQPDYPSSSPRLLWAGQEAQADWAQLPAWLGYARQDVELAPGQQLAWADWLSARLRQRAGDYPLPAGFGHHRLWQCGARLRRLALLVSVGAALLGVGLFAWGEWLNADSARLRAQTSALALRQRELAAALGPEAVHAQLRSQAQALLALRQRWPRLHEDLDALARWLAQAPALQLNAAHWRVDPSQLAAGAGASLQLEFSPHAGAPARAALAELHALLDAMRQAGWRAHVRQSPFDTRPDATLHSDSDAPTVFVAQLTLPGRRGAPP